MYVRVTPAHFNRNRYDDLLGMTRERLLPALRQLPGFQSFHGCIDREAGKLLIITVWETEEQARTLRDIIRDLVAQLQAIDVELESPEIYELAVQS